ncbi:hypothetical protein H6G20_19435 [Desertifilum sp. FACHB-1129]|uniref:Uncharacterized protein n=2 Tax=Cyanophyceae TaxID=3028117 RepID=A0A1E5QQI6_9CYAN|nr:hypothetical protein [Desertifilum sp. FACHB-866]MBD2313846.1 hypothetical protein [Desertifilum sp. FACHB-1129]MBD2333092.1 hypothetical protein [Desertifilum sp. FACHB-868]MCD8485205.1 hypothetical protein [Desertifilum sp.]MDA0212475.1 hypothetical protein [Cyanobacteria bacterium FC1]OEJ76929.1 hypothetical protein BH720_01675 [Desertifilum tharense IPPAS B-1220]
MQPPNPIHTSNRQMSKVVQELLQSLYAQAFTTRQISRFHLRLLSSDWFKETVTPEDRYTIRRLFHGVRRGWLKVID